jgi:hypothetical protein
VSRRRFLALSIAALAAAWLVTAPAVIRATDEPTAAPPLGNEEVVRMVAGGTAESDILEAIRSRPPAFDVSEDMLAELKLAGVPPAVIAAMKAREAQVAPQEPPPERHRAGTARLVVELSRLGAHTLHAPAYADEDVKHRLHLSKELADREVRDLAIFLACTTAEHVPDLWRQKSPLGRDMNLTVRHEMLAFVAGDTPAGKKPRLELPARLEADVDDTEPHDLVLGVAALVGDRWMQVSAGTLTHAKVAPGSKPLTGRISATPESLVFTVALTAPPK